MPVSQLLAAKSQIHVSRCILSLFLLPALCTLAAAQGQRNGGQSSSSSSAVASHLGNGYEALKQDRYDDAVTEFRAALALDPSLLERAGFPMAVALFESHKLDEARQQFESIRSKVGEHPNLLYYLGRIDLEQRKFPEAIRKLSQAASAPPFPDTSYYLGYAYLKNGNAADAEKWLRQAAASNPNDARIQYQLAQAFREEGLQDDSAKALALSNEIRRREDALSQIKTQCAQALERGPKEDAHSICDQLYDANDVEKLTALGALYGQHGDLEAAVKPLSRAAELAPQSPQMQYNLALVYFYLNRFEEARAHLVEPIKRWPDLYQLNALYGAVLDRLGEEEPAYRALKHAHELDPQNPATTELLFSCAMKLGAASREQKHNAEAIAYFREAASLNPNSAEPHSEMAAVHRSAGQLKLAEAEAAKARELSSAGSPR